MYDGWSWAQTTAARMVGYLAGMKAARTMMVGSWTKALRMVGTKGLLTTWQLEPLSTCRIGTKGALTTWQLEPLSTWRLGTKGALTTWPLEPLSTWRS